jgi:hypothetical protein
VVPLHLFYNELRDRRASIPYLNAGQSLGTVQIATQPCSDADDFVLYTLKKWTFGLHQKSIDGTSLGLLRSKRSALCWHMLVLFLREDITRQSGFFSVSIVCQ